MVTDDDPLDAVVAVVSANLGNTSIFTGDLVLDLVSLAVLRVDGADQAVLYNINVRLSLNTSISTTKDVREMFSRCPRYFNHGPPAEM